MIRTRLIAPLLLVAVIVTAGWALADAERPEHPDVDPAVPCDVCHAEMTPDIHAQWYSGAHGLNNVKCFVCHGSIGDDFTIAPEALRCVGCHADRVASIEQTQPEDTTCFSCHPPHELSPHVVVPEKAEGGEQ